MGVGIGVSIASALPVPCPEATDVSALSRTEFIISICLDHGDESSVCRMNPSGLARPSDNISGLLFVMNFLGHITERCNRYLSADVLIESLSILVRTQALEKKNQ